MTMKQRAPKNALPIYGNRHTHPAVPELLWYHGRKRYEAVRRLRPAPLRAADNEHWDSQANLDLLLVLAADPQRVVAGNLARILGWDRVVVQAALRWGERSGQVARISRRLYAMRNWRLKRQLPPRWQHAAQGPEAAGDDADDAPAAPEAAFPPSGSMDTGTETT